MMTTAYSDDMWCKLETEFSDDIEHVKLWSEEAYTTFRNRVKNRIHGVEFEEAKKIFNEEIEPIKVKVRANEPYSPY